MTRDRSDRPARVPRTLKASDNPDLAAQVMRSIKAPHRPVLVVLSGNEMGKRIVVDRNLLVGRDPDAALQLTDALVSWHHARIEDRGDGFALVDLDSTNGTTVNGRPCEGQLLRPNDRIVFGGTAASYELQDEVEQAYNEKVDQLMNVDDLSGLYVRRKFDAELDGLILAAAAKQTPLALLVMDLDGVKQINDTHGHLFGAYVIGEAGKVIAMVLGARGIACRFGGDEYLAALPGEDAASGARVAETLRQAIAEHPFQREGIVLRPGISIGVAAYPEDAGDRVSLFERADAALYRAKAAGKNCVKR